MTIIHEHSPSIFYEKDAADKIIEKINYQSVLAIDPSPSLDLVSKFLDLSSQAVPPYEQYAIEIYLKNSAEYIISPIAATSKLGSSGSIASSSNIIFPFETGKIKFESNGSVIQVLDLTLAVVKDPARTYYPVSDKTHITYINLNFLLNPNGYMSFEIKQVGVLYSDITHAVNTEQISRRSFQKMVDVVKKECLTFLSCAPPIQALNAPKVGVCWKSNNNYTPASFSSRHVIEFV